LREAFPLRLGFECAEPGRSFLAVRRPERAEAGWLLLPLFLRLVVARLG
jgi:hypothetical protein